MERLLRAKDIAERYSCSEGTARNYMLKMVHTENPLTVSMAALAAWESKRTVSSQPKMEKIIRQRNRQNMCLPDRFERKREA
jgi:hypothetical protein